MIEGLKPKVIGSKLQQICLDRSMHHCNRADKYAEQLRSMEANEIDGMAYTNGDPKRALRDKRDQHIADAAEMVFLAEHIDANETYILDVNDLTKLGICRSRY